MSRRRALTYLGGDIRIVGRRADGQAVVQFLDRHGQPVPNGTATAHAHQLRGVGWHLAAIKAAIASAPLFGRAAVAVITAPVLPPAPRLGAHFSLPKED